MRDGRARRGGGGSSSGRRRGEPAAVDDGGGVAERGSRGPVRRRSRGAPSEGAPLVAGYRLIRLVGTGRSCAVHLGRPERAADPGPAANVAVKIVPATDLSRGEAEVAALQSVVSEHVVALLDVATLADGSLCVVQSLGARGTAAAFVARRGSLTPGETVTLVVSVLRGLGDLHEAGLAHGALDLTHVVIDASGRPLLGGLGSSRPLSVGAAGADPGHGDPLQQDLTRVSRIVDALRDPLDARGAVSHARWDAWLELLDSVIHGESDLTAHDLADRLLDVADAAPLADAVGGQRVEDVDVRDAGTAHTASTAERPRGTGGTGVRPRGAARPTGPGARRHRALRESPPRRAALRAIALRRSMRRELGAVRPRVWAMGASALLLLVVGGVGLPLLTDAAHGEGAGTTTTTPPDPASTEAPSAPPSSVPDTTDADSAAASDPDPDLAAPALLRMRAACLRQADPACVSTVDEAGSALEDADRTTIVAGDRDRLDDGALHATDLLAPARRMGDGAIVELRPGPAAGADAQGGPGRRTASLLMVRGEAGWRIRDLMDDR
ncbi:serine/threonine protein kinase [Clavibacter capsici]|nr:serine/threonine protein kinase [Clavibacter capsici]